LNRSLQLICLFFLLASAAFSQNPGSFYYITEKEDFSLNVNGRLQNRFSMQFLADSANTYETIQPQFQLYRSRLSFEGMIMENTFRYHFQFGFSQAEDTNWTLSHLLYDAVAKWNLRDNIQLQFGQTIIPGNLGRMVRSDFTQFVERSSLSSAYSLDRDVGIQLHTRQYIGDFTVREKFVISSGEGRQSSMNLGGLNYGFRLEVLPFGEFTGGEYFEADLAVDDRPKLMLSLGYNVNDNALLSGGQKGGNLMSAERDIRTFYTDLHYKASAISVLLEYVNVDVDVPMIYENIGGNIVGSSFIAGDGLNAQVGYKFKGTWEAAGRFTRVAPLAVTGMGSFNEFTAALSYYIAIHRIKWQTDFSIRQPDSVTEQGVYYFRTQLQLGF
jgi:phosphate-selective porin OprO/OprP